MNKKWILGIVTPVATAVAIYWLTDGLKRGDTPAPTPAPETPQVEKYTWDGRVIDQDKGQLLKNVEVALAVGDQSFADRTDDVGRFIFLITKSNEPLIAVLKVAAQGYQPIQRQLAVDGSGLLERVAEVFLRSVPAGPAPAPTGLPKPTLTGRAAITQYQPRGLESAVKVIVPPKIARGR